MLKSKGWTLIFIKIPSGRLFVPKFIINIRHENEYTSNVFKIPVHFVDNNNSELGKSPISPYSRASKRKLINQEDDWLQSLKPRTNAKSCFIMFG